MSGIVTRRAGYAAAWMRAGATQVQAIDGRPVLRPAGQGAHEKQLSHVDVTMKDVAFGNAERILEIFRYATAVVWPPTSRIVRVPGKK